MMMSKRAIPLVDLNKYRSQDDSERATFVEELGNAFHKYGFVGVINHGIPQDLVDQFYNNSKSFFSLDKEIKKKYEVEGLAGQRGYTSFGREHAKQSMVGDLKEFYQIGQEVSDNDPIKDEYPQNIRVSEHPEFVNGGIALYKAFEKSGGLLLEAIAQHLDLDRHYFFG